ncbi:MAG: DUF58 domain-containing protein [Saprospiraceae bacterium]
MLDWLEDIGRRSIQFVLFAIGFVLLFLGIIIFWQSLGMAIRIGLVIILVFWAYALLRKVLKNIFLTNRFFMVLGGIIALFCASFVWDVLFSVGQTMLIMFTAIAIVDAWILFRTTDLKVKRTTPKLMSLGDENSIYLTVESMSNLALSCNLIDEIPVQFQDRTFNLSFSLEANEEKKLSYDLKPTSRGEYLFEDIHLFIKNSIGIIERRISYEQPENVPVYPSIIQMKQFELKSFHQFSNDKGVKKMRRIGHSYEFEQIKNYVRGDDYRSINWKATSRRAQLMVNQFQDERSQQVYSIIDKSRTMKMPFNGLSLMDYAINTSLVISNVTLQKHDRAGLLTFSDKIGAIVKAERKTNQLNRILTTLYREQERDLEANYELLYSCVRRFVQGRSLLFLYTNFESQYAMERVLPILRRLNNVHLLVVVFFENTEMNEYVEEDASTVQDIYYQTTARQFLTEKQQIVYKLKQYGIQSILTKPEDLSINTVNKYLEMKSRGLI